MNIWIVNHYALSPEGAGGTRHFNFSRYLSERGHQITIIASSYNHWSRKDEHLERGETHAYEVCSGVGFLWLKTPIYLSSLARLWNMLVFAFCLWRNKWSRDTGVPDLIVASSPHLFAAFSAYLLARKYRVPFVLEVRDLWPQTLIDLGKISTKHPLVIVFARIEKYLYRKASRIISLLPGAVDHIVQKAGDAKKIKWIPNGVDLDHVPQLRPQERQKVLSVYYAGSHGLANGLQSIVDAAEILQRNGLGGKVCFHFLGEGPDKKRLVDYVKRNKIDNVFFHSPVPKAQIYDVLQRADVFIATLLDSDLYRFGISLNKIYDYLALAKPVVFGANSSNNPVSDSGGGYVVAPEDSAAMAKAVEELLDLSSEERIQMGIKGRKYIEEHNDIKQLSKNFEQVCRDCLGE
ncbi:glycosyltransferase family 4 protein [Deltaproteobacteria bacterium]|nr:glycosyltransferase family 4 protein [Deltaproteobacteria bacterium]